MVVLFAAFPAAFAAISVALHVPLTLFLIGVVFRGSAFAFRAYRRGRGERAAASAGVWIFSLASVISPLLLGMIVGAIASGRIRVEHGVVTSGFLRPVARAVSARGRRSSRSRSSRSSRRPTSPSRSRTIRSLLRDFRARALVSGVAVGACALLAFLLSGDGAPLIRDGLTRRPWTWPLHGVTALVALGALVALARWRFRLARVLVVIQTVAILAGWVASQYPFLLVPDLTIWNTAAAPETRIWLLIFLAAGVPVLVPSLVVLLHVFKTRRA